MFDILSMGISETVWKVAPSNLWLYENIWESSTPSKLPGFKGFFSDRAYQIFQISLLEELY